MFESSKHSDRLWRAIRKSGLNLNLNLTLPYRCRTQDPGPDCEMGPQGFSTLLPDPLWTTRTSGRGLLSVSLAGATPPHGPPGLSPSRQQLPWPLRGGGCPCVRNSQAGPLREGAEACEGLVCVTLFIFSEGSRLSPAIKITCLETSSPKGRKKLLYPDKWL